MRPIRYVTLGLALFGLWILLSGHYEPLILAFGVLSSALVSYVAWRMDREDNFAFPVPFSLRLPGYLLWLLKEMFKANVNVAQVILNPKLPISPIMVPFRANQRSDYFRMIYANSITLTPGTITTGTDGEVLRIHALTWHDVDGREEDEMDLRIAALERGK
ncbi:Na+/H+ antiporter subunit E [Gemmatimonadota bacterium]